MKWSLCYVINFADGGCPEYGLLHEGTKEECEQVSDMLPAISYSGERPVKNAQHLLISKSENLD